jgi:hypothetical protein
VQLPDVLLQVVLRLVVDPLLEVVEVEHIRIRNLPAVQPLQKEREVLRHLLTTEDSVHHVAAEQSQLDFVASVCVDLLVFVDALENMRCCRTVSELQLLKGFL